MKTEQAIKLLHRLQDEQFDGEYGDERREALEMAVRALFSQQIVNDSQGLVNDCISRKMAIDSMWKIRRQQQMLDDSHKADLVMQGIYLAEKALEQLPSAQPERPEQPESAEEYCAECDHIEMCRWYPYEGCEFRSLPSAQPERKKGHWVEIGDEPYDEWECDVCGFVIDGSGCIDPEEYRDVYRFCPRCGARMER